MTKFVQLASITALLAGTTLYVTGCECTKTDQKDPQTGNTVTECESLKKFVGSEVTETLTYTDGYDLVVEGVNGNIDVEVGSGSDVTVSVTPFSVRGFSKESEAKADIENDVIINTSADGQIFVEVDRTEGAFNGVGGDIVITLPSSFNGDVNIAQNNGFVEADLGGATPLSVTIINDGAGDIDVLGARGKLDLRGDFDINVDVDAWSPEDGNIISEGGLGNISINVPADADGSIEAVSDSGIVIGPSTLPEGWVEDAAGENSKTFTFGDVAGGAVSVSGGDDVTITAD